MDMDEYEHSKAESTLLAELAKGELAAKERGTMTFDELKAALGV